MVWGELRIEVLRRSRSCSEMVGIIVSLGQKTVLAQNNPVITPFEGEVTSGTQRSFEVGATLVRVSRHACQCGGPAAGITVTVMAFRLDFFQTLQGDRLECLVRKSIEELGQHCRAGRQKLLQVVGGIHRLTPRQDCTKCLGNAPLQRNGVSFCLVNRQSATHGKSARKSGATGRRLWQRDICWVELATLAARGRSANVLFQPDRLFDLHLAMCAPANIHGSNESLLMDFFNSYRTLVRYCRSPTRATSLTPAAIHIWSSTIGSKGGIPA